MTTPHKISQWLSGTLPEAFEMPALREVVETYPYFWPAGLLLLNNDDEELDYTTAPSLRALYAPAPMRVMAEMASMPAEQFSAMEDPIPTPNTISTSEVPSSEKPFDTQLAETDATISHGLEHDPLEDAVASTFAVEEGGLAHNSAASSTTDADSGPDTDDTPIAGDKAEKESAEPLPQPLFTSDYFSHQGVAVDAQLPDAASIRDEPSAPLDNETDPDRGLMVMRSFTDWMNFFQRSARAAQEEEESKRAVRAMWQKEKLAAALEEEEDEIPEDVFQMAVASIEPDTVESEPLAQILAAQGKWERAIDMYRKLATKEPSKSAYFARKIEALEAQHPAQ